MESTNEFNDISLGVQLWSKWNYMINIWCQPMDSSILKSLCQAKQQKHMNNKKRILTWFNTCGLLITKKELIKCYI
jgi:hypothetical protein